VFVEGVHYAVDKNGNADKKKPLRWTADGYTPAKEGDPLHNDAFGSGDTTLEPGSE
jgi:hypothetical protein